MTPHAQTHGPIFVRGLKHHDTVPRTPTNTERMQAFRAIAPVQFYNTRFNTAPKAPGEKQ